MRTCYEARVRCMNCSFQGRINILISKAIRETPCPYCHCANIIEGIVFLADIPRPNNVESGKLRIYEGIDPDNKEVRNERYRSTRAH